jgi:endo-1,3-1,4-beta-glycanase ExoK
MFKITPALLLATTLCIGVLTSVTTTAKTYKGAEIYSSETHKYGRYVTRMRMAKGSGVLSTLFKASQK